MRKALQWRGIEYASARTTKKPTRAVLTVNGKEIPLDDDDLAYAAAAGVKRGLTAECQIALWVKCVREGDLDDAVVDDRPADKPVIVVTAAPAPPPPSLPPPPV